MDQQYDAIIIGAGHNGLVAAATLAQAGQKVLVVEQRDVLGGAAATEELFPGYKVNIGAHDAGLLQEEIVHALFLKMHGLELRESPVALFAPQPDGRALTLWRDRPPWPQEAQNTAEIARFSKHDAEQFPAYARQAARVARVLRRMMLIPPPEPASRNVNDLVGWGKVALQLKGLGGQEMMEFMRILPMPAREYLDEWFESDALKGALGAASVTGTMQGPRSAGTTLVMMLMAANGQGGFRAGRFVHGGMGQLAAALAEAARRDGAEIRTGTAVARVLLRDGQAAGVVLAGGEEIEARAVLSSADPRRTFLGLVGAPNLEPRFVRAVRNIKFRGSTAKMNLALSGLPEFRGQTGPGQLSGHIVISPSLDYLERAYDDAKYGRISEQPVLDIVIPTVLDHTLAPEGRHILSINMQFAPYHLREGNWDEMREPLGDRIIETLAQYAPNIRSLLLHRQVMTPLDWERTLGLTEGSIFQGQMGLDQLLVMRPVPGWSRYRMPIAGLYLCGAGAHPGGGVTGLPGYHAARELLAAWKRP
ncbi:MAG: phytoene desaturase family protein [Anaerolineae bacterium]